MNERTSQLIGWTIIGAVEPAGFFNAFTPTIFEIRQIQESGNSGELAKSLDYLRACYIPSTGLSLALGLGLSLLARSPLPLVASGMATAVMIGSYESALPPAQRLIPWGARKLRQPNVIDGTFRVLD